MNQFISRGKDLIAEAKVHLVFVNKEGKPVKVPDEINSKFDELNYALKIKNQRLP